MNTQEQIEECTEFIKTHYEEELHKISSSGEKTIVIDFNKILEFKHELADQLLDDPDETIKALEVAVETLDLGDFKVRISNLPKSQFILIRDIRSSHLGKFVYIEGIVRQASDVRPQVISARFECPSCGNTISILQFDTKFKEPSRCTCGRRGHFRLTSKDLVDAQRLVMEEVPEALEGGAQPKRLSVFLKEDLVEPKMEKRSTPGSKVRIMGIIKEVPITLRTGGQSTRYDLSMDANLVEPIEETFADLKLNEEDIKKIQDLSKDPKIYEKLTKSIAPSIYGHDKIKEAILLQMFGGVRKEKPDGTTWRGDSHILLVGDPGASKSSILQFISHAAPKARFVAGKGVSAAGLTGSVVKDEFMKGWALEAGALVLANGGICCLHPNTRVVYNHKISKIEDLFNETQKTIGTVKGHPVELTKLKGQTPSFDLESYKVKNQQTKVLRRKYIKSKIISLKLRSGFEIKVTPDHLILDGNTGKWKSAENFTKDDFILSPLKIPSNNNKIHLLDIIPKDWKVSLDKKERANLKRDLLKHFNTIKESIEIFKLPRDFFSNHHAISLKKLKRILKITQRYDTWKERTLKFIRVHSGERLKSSVITSNLGYILGFLFGDGHVRLTKRRSSIVITQCLANKKYIDNLKKIWTEVFYREPNIYQRKVKSKIANNKELERLEFHYGSNLLAQLYDYFVNDDLNKLLTLPDKVLKAFIAGAMDSDGCISIKNCTKNEKNYQVKHIDFLLSKRKNTNLNFMLALRRLDVHAHYIHLTKNSKAVRITGRKDVNSLVEEIQEFSLKAQKSSPLKRKTNISSISDKLPKKIVADICKKISLLNKSLLLEKGVWSNIYDYKKFRRQPSRDQLSRIINRLQPHLGKSTISKMNKLLQRDFFLDKIVKINSENYKGFVYDLYVPGTHNFLANGIIVHNCIDELDKVGREDLGAMHSAMEQQIIPISKANIQATLISQTTILAAANPKLGRFDPYAPIASQIELESTLINRFDLIFPIRDIPDREKDDKIASHVLASHQSPKDVRPEIETELLKKYISYSKQELFPKLSKEAIKEIHDFYVELRNKGQSGDDDIKPIPISARQLEALVRLSEASARVRLSKKVNKEDAQRAIALLRHCLMQVGFDYETGEIDIDRISTGISTSERSRIVNVREIINELEKRVGKQIPLQDVLSEAEDKGIDESKVEEAIDKLKREGYLFEPKRGILSKL